jgi:hypothetical protein
VNELEVLLSEREISRAIYRFARAMDERDWSALDAILSAEASADLGTGSIRGRAAIVANMRSFLDACGPTQHLIGNILVEIDGDSASSRCYVSDLHRGTGAKAELSFSTIGEYHDRWQRSDRRWWMVHRSKLSRALIGSIEVLGPGPSGWSPPRSSERQSSKRSEVSPPGACSSSSITLPKGSRP